MIIEKQPILTPKEKALDLWWKYYSRIEHTLSEEYSPHEKDITKYLAVVAVDEIINTLNYDIRDLDVRGSVLLDLIQYWKDVKQEIEKL